MSYIKLKNLYEEYSLISDINGFLSWDMATYMPIKSRKQRVKQIKKLYDFKDNIFNEIKKKELFKRVDKSKLSKLDKLNFELMKEKFDYLNSISAEMIKKKAELSIECEGNWRKAKEKSNFKLVKDSLKKLVELIKEESEILSQKKNKKK